MTETFHAGPGLGRLSDVTIIHGDCLEAMAELAADSIDAIVTDPPYGLEFMGKEWDSFGPQRDARTAGRSGAGAITAGANSSAPGGIQAASGRPSFGTTKPQTWRCDTCNKRDQFRNHSPKVPNCQGDWQREPVYEGAPRQMLAFQQWCELWTTEALRVLKPGGHLLAFGGTRTWHRLAVAVEDAGFEIRDSIAWLYGSGFPKSLDVSKAIDKAAGATREVVGRRVRLGDMKPYRNDATNSYSGGLGLHPESDPLTVPATPEAEQWSGWGTALKPAFEPVVVARKPLGKGTVAANVLAHGTGALNIDGCRIEGAPELRGRDAVGNLPNGNGVTHGAMSRAPYAVPSGRWPANVVLDADQAAALDEQSGTLTSGKMLPTRPKGGNRAVYGQDAAAGYETMETYGDSGGASRFFYVAKAPKKERPVTPDGVSHPTVKPLALMRWLVRLVTPPGGVVLDPFAGSGTTVEAALLEDFRVIGIEREADYLPMIQQRIARCLNS